MNNHEDTKCTPAGFGGKKAEEAMRLKKLKHETKRHGQVPACHERDSTVSFSYYVPRKPLSEFVDRFWYWKGHDVPHSKERVLPSATVELVINLGSGRTSDSVISGAKSESSIIERTAQDELLGVHFKPGGAFPFLRFPFGDLHNIEIGLDDLWGDQRASQLLGMLHETRQTATKFQILEKWLMNGAARPLKHHPAITVALAEFQREPNLISTTQMAENVNLSHRRFIQVFRNEVGLTPKLFCRVQRFNQVVDAVAQTSRVDWLDVALSCGYFDQPHFIHDFQEFSGLSPTEYMGLRTEHLRHVKIND